MALQIAFYLLAAVTLGSGLAVVSSKHPVHSVLFLIAAFFSAAGLFVLMGAEFLAMLLIVVYVGAVAVLFLFVVMMLDVDFVSLRQGFAQYLPIGGLVAGILTLEMVMVAATVASRGTVKANALPQTSLPDVPNAEMIGRVLYTDYVYIFQAAGVRRQVIADQTARGPGTGMKLVQIQPGASVAAEQETRKGNQVR